MICKKKRMPDAGIGTPKAGKTVSCRIKTRAMYLNRFCLCLSACFLSVSLFAQLPSPLEIELEPFITGMNDPVGIYHCGDDRLFIIEQDLGHIEVYDAMGNDLGTFLDIGGLISNGSERGLLGLAFHPDYANNGFFFVNYTDGSGDTQVARYTVSGNPNVADASSAELIINVDQPAGNHNGGHIAFGPDGFLYVALGDGGGQGDPNNYAQNPQNLLGKILRLDVDNGLPYSIPASNPFVGDATVLDEIWSIGFRNPWKFSFDRLTGDLWIGDVGQNDWEEVDFQVAASVGGENYGWRCYEGTDPYNTSGCAGAAAYVDPVAQVSHGGPYNWCSITGGHVYRGSEFPNMYGKYFFTDYCAGDFLSLTPNGGGFDQDEVLLGQGFGWVAFGEDMAGDLYVANLNGTIYKLVDPCGDLDPQISGNDVSLFTSGGDNYYWYQDGNLVAGANGSSFSPTEAGAYYCVVELADGCAASTPTVNWGIVSGILGCTNPNSDNYNPSAAIDDGSCIGPNGEECVADLDDNGIVNAADLLIFLGAFGQICD